MKRTVFLIVMILPLALSAAGIKAYLSYCTFSTPKDGPFLETYLSVYAKSITFIKTTDGKFQGSVGITMIFRQGEEIRDFKKYELKSPAVSDTNELNFSFLDQQRFLLPNGDYEFELQIRDLHNDQPALKEHQALKLDYPEDRINVSGIQLIESFKKSGETGILSKSGYDFVPYISNFYPKSVNKLGFYAEIYNTDKVFGAENKYLLSCYIQSNETGKPLTDLVKNRKEVSKPVSVAFYEFDISRLPSGNYDLVVEVRNQQNEVVAFNLVFFQRSNPDVQLELKDIEAQEIEGSFVEQYTNKDSLAEYIRCLAPISTETERVFAEKQLSVAEMKTMKQYFLNFWSKRDELNPGRSWSMYHEQVQAVNRAYKTPIKKGYETDRGRIYLKYGPPNTIVDQPFESSSSGMHMGDQDKWGNSDGGTIPYQIWHYYKLSDNQQNIRFVFANPHLAASDYQLIHSNANGEIFDPAWQDRLIRQIGIRDKDEAAPRGRFDGKTGDYYNIPR